ncbi:MULTISPECIES: glycoside hydrolase family 26 protein [unclassified Frankia]
MKHRAEGDPSPPRVRSGSRRGRRRPHHPAWIASLGVMALVAAAVGWTLVPERDTGGEGSATVEATAIQHGKPRHGDDPRVQPSVSAGTTGGLPGGDSSATVGSPSPSPAPVPAGTPAGTAPRTAAKPTTPGAAARVTKPAVQVPVIPVGGGGGSVPGGMSGVAAGTMTQVRAWESFRGSPVNVVLTFTDRSSWQTMTNPWLGSGPEKFSTFAGTWIISQPFYPTGGGDMNSCASGAYNGHWADFGRWLVAKGRPASIIRLAWEFNGDWFPWSVSKTNPTTWVNCFRQVVSAIRSTDPQARIDWTLNAHSSGAWAVYPGDQYVDIIGIDSYDQWPASTDDAAFASQCHAETGLCSTIAFARQHGKQFSVPEWGLVGKSDTGAGRAGRAGGDNPVYIRNMYQTFAANRDILAYETYFNDSEPGNVHSSLVNPTEHPAGAATYASLW